MSAHCISCRLESEKTCLLAKVKIHFTCINMKARRLIWTHSLNQFGAYLRKAKGKEEKKEEEETHFVVFGLLVFCLRACYLSLEILYSLVHCLVIYLEEV